MSHAETSKTRTKQTFFIFISHECYYFLASRSFVCIVGLSTTMLNLIEYTVTKSKYILDNSSPKK